MIKAVLLLAPIFVTLFWSILLNVDNQNLNAPRKMLGKVMLMSFLVFFFNLLFFIPLPTIYPLIEPFNQAIALLGYPLFYVYTRLLTVDDKFSIKAHGIFFIVPIVIFIFYIIGILVTPFEEYKTWVFNRSTYQSNTFGIQYLKIILLIIRITFLVSIVATMIANYKLIKKHGDKAARYYSDMEDSGVNKVAWINFAMFTTAAVSILWSVLGRTYFRHEMNSDAIVPTIISIVVSLLFTTMFFIIGWLGMKQKVLNPTFEVESEVEIESEINNLLLGVQDIVLDKILILFNENKVYLDSKLTIQDIAQSIGTNRTYISSVINQNYSQNFCTFVNSLRVDALEKSVIENPKYSLEVLAQNCGFGTVHSLKRAFFIKKQIPFPEWKKQILP
ncbi:MAG: hypothetical protein WCG93_10345 [Paludibacter sp.]